MNEDYYEALNLMLLDKKLIQDEVYLKRDKYREESSLKEWEYDVDIEWELVID